MKVKEFTFVFQKKDRLRHHVRLAHKKNTLGETIYKGHPSWLLMRDIQVRMERREEEGREGGKKGGRRGERDIYSSIRLDCTPT
jgi:hypothetical protein